ncbi:MULTISPECIES: hypothetical protein [Parageobacillus]|uniref:Uncharacterized protein n=1 Tax=Parageobacillus thermantarcticus TaxID=186116 RepID=A0A1I0TGX2_9BACL|nr:MULTISPECIES: hypothetical protein [Parageobacillus]MBY6268002.1 hypothetical protein [Parageobacillus thermoglucosidasius]OUM84918.1 MAG: hypothetical protein BAA00_02350 [Parageobacillus thermoglucosidasius]RDE19298.1 hypothetical protein DV714_19790 [Parageobacillus thermoglucosidasius]SFA51041.1 hypothetical protein SAMN05192569_102847 [Parageobacillus thermantarcticus]
MDVDVSVRFKQSEINGLFQEVEELKRKRAHLKGELDKVTEQINKKTNQIIHYIQKNGNVLAYKNNVPYILSVKQKISKKFDKSQLANDVGKSTSELNLIGVAELVEERKISSQQLKQYEHEETNLVLKARKAKKSDIDLLGARAL